MYLGVSGPHSLSRKIHPSTRHPDQRPHDSESSEKISYDSSSGRKHDTCQSGRLVDMGHRWFAFSPFSRDHFKPLDQDLFKKQRLG